MKNRTYVSKVLSYIECDYKVRKRLREDLIMTLENKSEDGNNKNPIELMGSPREVALEIIDDQSLRLSEGFEYISSFEIFGLPLVHVTTKKRVVAKGIFAAGFRSIGVFTLGLLSLGIFSTGILSFGLLFAVGSLSFSGFLSLGAVAISGYLSLGAVSIGQIAVGAVAIGNVALGDVAIGDLALYKSSGSGKLTLNIYEQKDLVEAALRNAISNNFIMELVKDMVSTLKI